MDGRRAERSAQSFELGAQTLRRGGRLLDKYEFPRAARQRLESERARAGEQIQAAGADDVVLQPIEQGFADAVRRGSQARQVRHGDTAPAKAPADDTNRSRPLARAVGRFPSVDGLLHTRIIPRKTGRGRGSAKLRVLMPTDTDSASSVGFFKRLRNQLSAGTSWIAQGIKEILPGRKIDAEVLDELETRLITADVGMPATTRILADLHTRVARKELSDVDALLAALHQSMVAILRTVERPLVIDRGAKPYVILVVGINGAGKTTTIGKLARRLLNDGASVLLASGDTFRAAAREQLQTWAERNQVPIVAQQQGAEPAAVIFDALQAARARHIDVLIADTAGRLHTQAHLMAELKKVKRVLARLDAGAPHEVLLVLDGTIGQNAVAQAEEFHKSLGVTGLVVTKLDGTAKGGVLLAIAEKLSIPIRFIGVGEQIEDFGVFQADEFVTALLKSAPGDAA